MNTYEASVRIQSSGMVINTLITAENSMQAYFLLQGLYGKDNVIFLPTEVR